MINLKNKTEQFETSVESEQRNTEYDTIISRYRLWIQDM